MLTDDDKHEIQAELARTPSRRGALIEALRVVQHRAGWGSDADVVEVAAFLGLPVSQVEDVATFTRSHGLGDLPNWHFLAGTPTQLEDVLSAYGIVVQVPAVGMVSHG